MPRIDASAISTIAIAICTRDRPDALLRTLDSILKLTRKPDEFILVDDGILTAAQVESARAACARGSIPFRFAANERPGLTRARNLAVQIATSDVVQFLDDDVDVAPDFLTEIERLFRDPYVSGVSANVSEPTFENRHAKLFNLGCKLCGWWSLRPRGTPKSPRPGVMECETLATRARHVCGAAMAFRRSVLLDHPFDETLADYALGEDREIGYRLSPTHWILHAPRARVVHRRDPGSRTSPRRFGYMAARNYLYILHKTCRPRWYQRIQITASLAGVAAMHALLAILGRGEHHRFTLEGMIDGYFAWHTRAPRLEPAAPAVQSSTASSDCRVLFVTNRLEHGGAEAMLAQLASGLPARRIRPVIACLKDAGPLAAPLVNAGIHVYERVLNYKSDYAALRRLKNMIRQEGIDVVVAAHTGGDRMFWSTLAGRLTGTPVVAWSHWSPIAGRSHIERINRRLYRFVKRFVALGERPRQQLGNYEGVPLARTIVIPNGINVAAIQSRATPEARTQTRINLDIADNEVAVGIIANLRREKRHDVFIEAANRLAADRTDQAASPPLRFFIIGDGPERQAIEKLIQQSAAPVSMLGTRNDIPELLAALDITCLCSELECLSIVMLEAAAAGSVFIGPDSGAMGEFIVHGETGWLTRPADVDSLTQALRTLSRDSARSATIASNAKARVTESFGLDRMVEQFAELFRTLKTEADMAHNPANPSDVSSRPKGADDKLATALKAT